MLKRHVGEVQVNIPPDECYFNDATFGLVCHIYENYGGVCHCKTLYFDNGFMRFDDNNIVIGYYGNHLGVRHFSYLEYGNDDFWSFLDKVSGY